MSRRETQIEGDLQQWRGVDQRTQPTLVQNGFFVMSRGVFFGLGDNAERLPGKRLAGVLDQSVFQIQQFGNKVLVQSMGSVFIGDVEELTDFDIILQPGIPGVPTFDNVSYFTLDVVMPNAFPSYTISFSLESSLDGVTWIEVANGLAPLQVVPQSGLDDDTEYYYRVIAVGTGASTSGSAATVTTLPRLPDAPAAPTYNTILVDSFNLVVPALSAFADDMDLERSPDGIGSWTSVTTGLTGGEVIPFTGEATGVTVYFRMIANNVHGSTDGLVSSVTPNPGAGDFRITEDGDIRITEAGDFRVIE